MFSLGLNKLSEFLDNIYAPIFFKKKKKITLAGRLPRMIMIGTWIKKKKEL